MAYLDGGVDVKEGDDNALEGLEGRPGVDLCMLVYCFAELGECADIEELWGEEVLKMMLVMLRHAFSKIYVR